MAGPLHEDQASPCDAQRWGETDQGIFTRIVDSLDKLPRLPEDMSGIPLIDQRVRKMKFIRTMSNGIVASLLGTFLRLLSLTLKANVPRHQTWISTNG